MSNEPRPNDDEPTQDQTTRESTRERPTRTNGVARIVLAGPDDGDLAGALSALGVEPRRVDGIATRDSLREAGVDDADVLVLTDMADASVIPVAKDENPGIRVVTYSRDSLPEFARGQTDLAIDPALLGPDVVAEELI